MTYFSLFRIEWRLLLFGLTLTCLSGFGQTFFISLFNTEIRTAFDLSHTGFGSLYSVATLTSAACIIWIGKMIDHVDLRLFTAMICLTLVCACFILGLANSAIILCFALFLIRMSTQGLMGHTSSTSMARYLADHRGKAIGFTALGHRLSEMILPVPALFIAGYFGWRTSWMIFGGFILCVVIPWTLWLLRGHKERHEDYMKQIQADEVATDKKIEASEKKRQKAHWTRKDVLKDWRFYMILPCTTATAFIVTGIFFHQEALVAEKGWNPIIFASSFTAFALSGIFSTLVSGSFVDKLGSLRILPFYLFPFIASLFVLSYSTHPATPMAFMILAGLSVGMSATVYGALWPEIYGTLHLGAIRSVLMSLAVFTTALSPPLFGWFMDHGVALSDIIFYAGVYVIFAVTAVSIGVRRF